MRSILSVTSDEDLITLELMLGLHCVVIPQHAAVLLERLIEFRDAEGSAHIELSPVRSLAVTRTESGIEFCFFRTGQKPRDWVSARNNELDTIISQLRRALTRHSRLRPAAGQLQR